MDSAFTARFYFKPNRFQNDNPKAPDKNLITQFTVTDARKAARWLNDQADAAEMPGGSTIKQYTSKTDYKEVAGFPMYGSYWSKYESGTIAPRA